MEKIASVLSSKTAQDHLIHLYRNSQAECNKNGKLSMEIGASREKDLIAVLRHHLGDDIEYNIGVHAPEDIRVCGDKFSIKHLSCGAKGGSIKWKWTSDAKQAARFKQQLLASFTDDYYSNMLLVYIDARSMIITMFGIMKDVIIDGVRKFQDGAFTNRIGTNNRGVEYSLCMIRHMLDGASFKVVINNCNLSSCCDPIEKRIRLLKMNSE